MNKFSIVYNISRILIIAFLLLFFIQYCNKQSFKVKAEILINSGSINHFLDINKFDYDDSTFIVQLNFNTTYDQLELMEQFMELEFLQRQLRYLLRNGKHKNSLDDSDIRIIVQSPKNKYILMNKIDKSRIFNTQSDFQINGMSQYTYTHFGFAPFLQIKNRHVSDKDLEVMQFAKKHFNLITSNGKNYNPKQDSEIILQTITEKFGISKDEYDKIYKQIFLNITEKQLSLIEALNY